MKLGMLVYHHDLECHAKVWVPIFTVKVTVWAQILKNECPAVVNLLQPNLVLTIIILNCIIFIVVHHHEPECCVKILGSCSEGQGHSDCEGSNPLRIFVLMILDHFAVCNETWYVGVSS